jgi:hypothetical protein
MTDTVLLPEEPVDGTAPARAARPTPGFMLGSLMVLIVVALFAVTYHSAAIRDRDRAANALDRARIEVDSARRARDAARQDLAMQRRAVASAGRNLTVAQAASRRTATRGVAAQADAQSTASLSSESVDLARRMTEAVAAGDVAAYNRDRAAYNDRFAATASELARAVAALQRRLTLL